MLFLSFFTNISRLCKHFVRRMYQQTTTGIRTSCCSSLPYTPIRHITQLSLCNYLVCTILHYTYAQHISCLLIYFANEAIIYQMETTVKRQIAPPYAQVKYFGNSSI